MPPSWLASDVRYPRGKGCPTVALLAHAADAELLAVGTRGRNALTSALLGSITLNLLRHSTVPVMVCPAAPAVTHR